LLEDEQKARCGGVMNSCFTSF